MKLKCKCGYSWESNSDMLYATCPSCRLKVLNPKKLKENHPKMGTNIYKQKNTE